MSIGLRVMRWWDIEPALDLEWRLFPDNPWTVGMFWSELAGVPATRHYLVADERGRVLGYAGLAATRHEAEVQTIAVDPDRQGEGLGRRLLDALLAEASRRGCADVFLEARADNERAIELYRQSGFEPVGVRRGYYQPGRVDAVLMRRRMRRAERRMRSTERRADERARRGARP
jgi:[ribosomal protein S18]-alanine N-acetyltransferase